MKFNAVGLRRWLVFWTLIACFVHPTSGQPLPTPVAVTESATPAPSNSPVEATPGLSDLADRLEESRTLLAEMKIRLHGADQRNPLASNDIPLGPELERLVTSTLKSLEKNPSMAELRDVESEWEGYESDLKGADDRLTAQAAQCDVEQTVLDEQSKIWSSSPAEAQADLPLELQQGVNEVLIAISEVKKQSLEIRSQVLLAQARVARAQSRVRTVLATVRSAREARVERLLVRDGVPIWKCQLGELSQGEWLGSLLVTLESERDELARFGAAHSEQIVVHALFLVVLWMGLGWARVKVTAWAVQEPVLTRTVSILSAPIPTALIVTVYLLTPLFYTRAPVLVRVGLSCVALFMAILILRKLLGRAFSSASGALIVLFGIYEFRRLILAHEVLNRVLFLVEMAGSIAFLAWLLKYRLVGMRRRLRLACALLTGIFSLALLSNLLGYLQLSYWLGDGATGGANLGVFLYASVEVVGGLTLFSLRLPPLSLLTSVRQNRHSFRSSLLFIVRLLALALWLTMTLDSMGLQGPLFDRLASILQARATVGSLNFSLGGLTLGVLTLWLTGRLARLSQYVLELDVFPRFQLERGVDYTLSTLIRYMILLVGVLFGLAAVGVDTTKFTIVAGALGVGIGFGLQNIVNNFVSGLILLFERPIKVGDLIQVNERVGMLKQVGLRASIMRTAEGAEVIVPNGQLLSSEVTNWTLSDPLRRIQLDIGVAYGSKPREVMALLANAATRCKEVLEDPKPSVLFVGLGESTLEFRVQVWTQRSQTYPTLQSDLLLHIYEALEAAGIEIPYPHRSVILENWPGSGT